MSNSKTRVKPPRRRHGRTERTSQRSWFYIAVPALIIVVAGVGASLWITPTVFGVKEAYAYTEEHSKELQYIPCFCGCGGHAGHTSIHDCFVKREHLSGGPVVYDMHGANCDMCVDIVSMSSKMIKDGKSLGEIRQAVTSKYGNIGSSTSTPLPPVL